MIFISDMKELDQDIPRECKLFKEIFWQTMLKFNKKSYSFFTLYTKYDDIAALYLDFCCFRPFPSPFNKSSNVILDNLIRMNSFFLFSFFLHKMRHFWILLLKFHVKLSIIIFIELLFVLNFTFFKLPLFGISWCLY